MREFICLLMLVFFSQLVQGQKSLKKAILGDWKLIDYSEFNYQYGSDSLLKEDTLNFEITFTKDSFYRKFNTYPRISGTWDFVKKLPPREGYDLVLLDEYAKTIYNYAFVDGQLILEEQVFLNTFCRLILYGNFLLVPKLDYTQRKKNLETKKALLGHWAVKNINDSSFLKMDSILLVQTDSTFSKLDTIVKNKCRYKITKSRSLNVSENLEYGLSKEFEMQYEIGDLKSENILEENIGYGWTTDFNDWDFYKDKVGKQKMNVINGFLVLYNKNNEVVAKYKIQFFNEKEILLVK